jgi:hypothetical protein
MDRKVQNDPSGPRAKSAMLWPAIPAAALLFLIQGAAADVVFPKIRSGIWELTAVRTLPNGKVQTWKQNVRECRQVGSPFQGYWGLGIVEKRGCAFESTEKPDGTYKISSKCAVRGPGVASSEATVRLIGDDAFEMVVDVLEGRRHYHATQIGRLTGACPP